jgi:protein involved in polysaccharide export with SLBB domain
MLTRRRTIVRAGFLLACSLTLGCQSVGPRGVASTGPTLATAPTIVARAAPRERSEVRQVAAWPADGEQPSPWRPVQRPAEGPAGSSAWTLAQHVGDAALVSAPVITVPPPALSEVVRNPALAAPRQAHVLPHGPIVVGAPPVHAPLGQGPFETQLVSLPPYRIGPPDILLVESTEGLEKVQPVRGQHLVRPDGTIGVGIYGSVYVAGMTLDQAREAVSRLIYARKDPEKVKFEDVLKGTNVDVISYNSQVYYVITDGAGLGQQVVPIPITGRETVLDALAKVNGLSPVSSKRHIWVARRGADGFHYNQRLDVDWIGITERGEIKTNYQIMPGDRVYVQSDAVRRFDYTLAKFLSPVERLFGVTLLSSQAINSIRSGSISGGVR